MLRTLLHLARSPAHLHALFKVIPAIQVFLVWFGLVWFGLVWFGLVWFGLVWFGLVWFGLVWFGLVWFGLVWFGLVWFGLVWFGLVWFGLLFVVITICFYPVCFYMLFCNYDILFSLFLLFLCVFFVLCFCSYYYYLLFFFFFLLIGRLCLTGVRLYLLASLCIPCAAAVLFPAHERAALPRIRPYLALSFGGGAVTEVLHDLRCRLVLSSVRHDLFLLKNSNKSLKERKVGGSKECCNTKLLISIFKPKNGRTKDPFVRICTVWWIFFWRTLQLLCCV